MLNATQIKQTRANAIARGAQYRVERFLDQNGFFNVAPEGLWVSQNNSGIRAFVNGPNWCLYLPNDSPEEPSESGTGIVELQKALCE